MRVEVVDVIEMIEVPTATAGSVAAPEPAPLPRRS
jgi:hypothetical protein